MQYLLNTPYKGSRHYIHGSDLFNKITKIVYSTPEYESYYVSQLVFTRFTYHLCELVIDEVVEPALIAGKGIISTLDSKKNFYLVETGNSPTERYPFDEESLVAKAEYYDSSITLNQAPDYTSIETVIALTKALSYKLMPLDKEKWVFGRIDLKSSLPIINNSITINQNNAIQGRFSVNDIEIDGKSIGRIQFITGNP